MADAEDLFKKAGGLFSKLGKEMLDAGKEIGDTLRDTGKQVTGLGRGTVRVELDRTKAAPGDTLKGRVVLSLPEPVDAKRLVVSLVATQRMVELRRQGRGTTPMSTRSEVFRLDAELGTARAYTSDTMTFELLVPFDALDKRADPAAHPIAEAVRNVASVLEPTTGSVEWVVEAALDVPWGRNLAHEVGIVVGV
jgi:hypothetical protein